MRRYDISRDDRLRSMVEVQRVTRSSYFSLSSWGFQTLRPGEIQGQIPLALPIVDYRKRFDDPLVNGRLELQFNAVSLSRRSGQDTQRAFAGGRWDLRQLTGLGQEVSFTLYARGDLYHTDETQLTSVLPYRGQSGWSTRLVSAAAIDMRWPFIGPLFGGTQRLTPRLQIVTSPRTSNLKVPNEDARSVDLEDSNLFALNRFPGYDRWEDGTRITYGLDWGFEKPNWQVNATVGQSYRLSSKTTLFPDGTGLTNQTSDFVGRTSFKYKNFIAFTHRFRIDKDNLAVRRNELDATVGTTRTYITFGYLRLNRNVSPTLEDLRDREEIRLGGRVQMDRHWSVFGSTIIDLTDFSEDPVSLADGFQPIRHRFGFEYEDDCITFGITWKRDYEASGDARRGNTFVLRLSFRNLGR
jgi:LPS-assembly protein